MVSKIGIWCSDKQPQEEYGKNDSKAHTSKHFPSFLSLRIYLSSLQGNLCSRASGTHSGNHPRSLQVCLHCRQNADWARRSLFQLLMWWYFTLSHFVGRCIAGFRATNYFIVALYHFIVPMLQTDFFGNWSWFGAHRDLLCAALFQEEFYTTHKWS